MEVKRVDQASGFRVLMWDLELTFEEKGMPRLGSGSWDLEYFRSRVLR